MQWDKVLLVLFLHVHLWGNVVAIRNKLSGQRKLLTCTYANLLLIIGLHRPQTTCLHLALSCAAASIFLQLYLYHISFFRSLGRQRIFLEGERGSKEQIWYEAAYRKMMAVRKWCWLHFLWGEEQIWGSSCPQVSLENRPLRHQLTDIMHITTLTYRV